MEKKDRIIEYLLNKNQWVSANTLCEELSIAKRSLQRYIFELNEQFENLILSSKAGYKLDLASYQRYHNSQQKQNNRVVNIINQLVFTDSCINIYDLADELYVSESTIRNDLKTVRKIFVKYQLTLLFHNDEIRIDGSERNKRRLIKDYTYGEATKGFINLSSLTEYFPTLDPNSIKNIIINEFNSHQLFIDDYTLYNLVLHMLIKIERTREHNTIIRDKAEVKVHNLPFLMSESICNQISSLYDISFTVVEIFETSILISASVHIGSSASELKQMNESIPLRVSDTVKKIIEYANSNYEIDLNTPSFLNNFSLHIKNLYFRLENNIFVKNPLLSQLKNTYPFIYEISVGIVKNFFKEFENISEDEIAYITLHLASHVEETQSLKTKVNCIIISPEFYSLNKKLLNDLHQRYSEKLITTNILADVADLKNYFGKYDLILSTVDVPVSYIEKALHINLLLTRDDYNNLDEYIEKCLKEKAFSQFKNGIMALFNSEYFLISKDETNYKLLLKEMADKLQKDGYVKEEYLSSVLDRENASSTAYGSIAIPHPLLPMAEQSVIYVAISKKGFILDNGNKVKLVFLLANSKSDMSIFKYIFDFIAYYVTENIDLSPLTEAKNYNQFLSLMDDYIKAMINK